MNLIRRVLGNSRQAQAAPWHLSVCALCRIRGSGVSSAAFTAHVRDWLYGPIEGQRPPTLVRIESPPIDEHTSSGLPPDDAVVQPRGDSVSLNSARAGAAGWLTAAVLCRQRGIPIARLVGVEAEPSHFEWMKMVLLDNDIDPTRSISATSGIGSRPRGDVHAHRPGSRRKGLGTSHVRPEEMPNWESLPG